MSKPSIRHCAVYTRKSSAEGLEQEFNSLEAQREAGVAFVKSQAGEGWRLVETRYDDGAFSGGTLERPALQRLLQDIEAGRVQVVVVYKVDRLTRSLANFAKLVEVFEKKGVCFVSVTQQFNTTTSMGRLMLNVLLSFAQFEREVTGERIRDKIGASKKKGMWMGGVPPIGYEARGRKLTVVERDAEVVRHIFGRYLALGCITLLARELAEQGIRTRRYKSAAGNECGGRAFSRGHLHRILRNRMYRGEIAHHGSVYPGEHEAIIDEELWNGVQAKIDENRLGRRRPAGEGLVGILRGNVFDDSGNQMTATRMRKHTRQYRYYVSRAAMVRGSKAAGTVARVPAGALETAVMEAAREAVSSGRSVIGGASDGAATIDESSHERLLRLIERVVVQPKHLDVTLRKDDVSISLRPGVAAEDDDATCEERYVLRIPFLVERNRGSVLVVTPSNAAATHPTPNPALVKSVVRGNEWARKLLVGEVRSLGELAKDAGVTTAYVSRLVRYAFLAPEISESILSGTPALDLAPLGQTGELPLDWSRQRALVGL